MPVPRSSRLRYGFDADHGDQRRLDPFLRRVQGADLVPIDSALGEIGGSLPTPGLAHHLEPRAVGADNGIGRIETAQPVARQGAARFGEAEERPGALALPRGETRLDQELQMTRDARLRLAEDGDQFADRQFGRLKQAEDAQPRLLARRLETGEQRRKSQGSGRPIARHKHIFMSNLMRAQEKSTPAILPKQSHRPRWSGGTKLA